MDEELPFEKFITNVENIQNKPSPKTTPKKDHRRVMSYDPNVFKERNDFPPTNDFFL